MKIAMFILGLALGCKVGIYVCERAFFQITDSTFEKMSDLQEQCETDNHSRCKLVFKFESELNHD